MQVIASEQVIYFDVDDTLVCHGKVLKGQKAVAITCPYSGAQLLMRVHEPHLKILKDRAARGAHIIVWSAAGYLWAKAVVVALGVQHCVAQVQSKPIIFVDDKPAKAIMGEHLFLAVDDKYGS